MKSIIQDEKICFVCLTDKNLHTHHIFGGGRRTTSEKNGFKVYLCAEHHNMSNSGVHFNPKLDKKLKQLCQREFEKTHSRNEFMGLIGKNYLED